MTERRAGMSRLHGRPLDENGRIELTVERSSALTPEEQAALRTLRSVLGDKDDAWRVAARKVCAACERLAQEHQQCNKCGCLVPPSLIAIELDGGAPIDDPAGCQWCVVCHDQRVLSMLRAENERLAQENAEAIKVLAPNMPSSGLVDACRQVKQVAISEADNSDKAEALAARYKAALERYGRHLPDCCTQRYEFGRPIGACDCGLAAALLEKAPK